MDAGHLPTLAESVVSFAGGRVNSIPAKVGQFCAGADTKDWYAVRQLGKNARSGLFWLDQPFVCPGGC